MVFLAGYWYLGLLSLWENMWILLIAAAAAPIPVRVTVYDGCMSVNERTNELVALTSSTEHCPHLVFDTAVYCCVEQKESNISSVQNCSAPALEDTCETLVITTYNSFCCDTGPMTDTYDDKNTYNDDINDKPWFGMDDEQWLPNWTPD